MFLSVAYHAYIWLWFPCGFKLITLRCPPVIKCSNGKSKTYMERHSSLGKSSVNWPCSIPRKLPEVFFSREKQCFLHLQKGLVQRRRGGTLPHFYRSCSESLLSAPVRHRRHTVSRSELTCTRSVCKSNFHIQPSHFHDKLVYKKKLW